jgi:hypothetical protein
VIVSATTPAETFLACVTTATCLPQDDGQYHLAAAVPIAVGGDPRPRWEPRARTVRLHLAVDTVRLHCILVTAQCHRRSNEGSLHS